MSALAGASMLGLAGGVLELVQPTSRPFAIGVALGEDAAIFSAPDHGLSQYRAIRSAGFRTVRLEAGYDPSHVVGNDATIRAALAAGLDVLLILDGYDVSVGAAAFCSFCAAVVRTYSALGIEKYEILNEPNFYINWDPTQAMTVNPSEYAELLRDVYPVIKAAHGRATVIAGGIANISATDGVYVGGGNYRVSVGQLTWIRLIYRALGGNSSGAFDAVAVHPYTFPASPTGHRDNWGNALNPIGVSVRTIMVANGDAAKKIWITEFGAPTGTGTGEVSYVEQASAYQDALTLAQGYPYLEAFYCFNWNDDSDGDFGLKTAGFVGKPALAEVQQYLKGRN